MQIIKYKNLFLCSIIFFFLFFHSCGEQDWEKENETEIIVSGVWQIGNKEEERISFDEKKGYAILIDSSGHNISYEEYILLDDGSGIRLQKLEASSPEGYFLWRDKKGNSWTGIWKEELVRLVLLTKP